MTTPEQSPPSEGRPRLRISLERDPQAASLARAAVTGFMQSSGLPPDGRAMVTLLVSELVSNAVIHSDAPPASEILVEAQLLDKGVVRVEVIDQGTGFSSSRRDPAKHEGGFGLYLVERQSSRWGVDGQGGTRVWFELVGEDHASYSGRASAEAGQASPQAGQASP